jgi:cell division protein FtsB
VAKITVEMEVDDDLIEDAITNLKHLQLVLERAEELGQDLSFLSKATAANGKEIKKLSTSVQKILAELKQDGPDTRKES